MKLPRFWGMIESEHHDMRRDPDKEARLWVNNLVETDRIRRGYQELAAKGYMIFDDLGSALEELEKPRKTAERELDKVRNRKG
jgi:hypothetical protein